MVGTELRDGEELGEELCDGEELELCDGEELEVCDGEELGNGVCDGEVCSAEEMGTDPRHGDGAVPQLRHRGICAVGT